MGRKKIAPRDRRERYACNIRAGTLRDLEQVSEHRSLVEDRLVSVSALIDSVMAAWLSGEPMDEGTVELVARRLCSMRGLPAPTPDEVRKICEDLESEA